RPLAVAALADGEQRGRLLARDDRHADHLVLVAVAVAKTNTAHAPGRAAHRADVLLAEANRPAVARADEDVGRALGDAHGDEIVILGDRQRDDARVADVGEGVERGLLDVAGAGPSPRRPPRRTRAPAGAR